MRLIGRTNRLREYAYDAAGNVDVVTDPRGIQSLYTFDLLKRQTAVVLGHTVSSTPVASIDQTTDYLYDGNGDVIMMTADVPGSANQSTAYIYGVGSTIGTDLFSNDLIQKVEYPTPSGTEAGTPSTLAANDISYTYDLQGENASKTDQNGNVHAYSYNVLGHLTLDAVTTLGSGVDGSIRALGYSYTTVGLPFPQTSYSNSGGTTVVNQDQDEYNGFGQLTEEYQEHSGAVNTGSSLNVQYDYDTTGSNDSRLTAMIYPNGRQLDYVYNSGLDSDISRVSALADDGGSDAGTIQSYLYLGLNTIVQTTASIYHAFKKNNADLSKLAIQVKLTVLNDPKKIDVFVPLISRYANSQNKVNAADFSANHPYHVTLEELSRTIWAPG